jgi:hypothetical protein
VIKIAIPQDNFRGLKGEKTVAALKKSIPLCPDPTAKANAEKYLSTLRPNN